MGCRNSKTVAFVGTPDAEIQYYCGILGELAGYNWEQGSGPMAKADEALRSIHRIAENNYSFQDTTLDLYSTVVEALRTENPNLYGKFVVEINKARGVLASKIQAPDVAEVQTSAMRVGKWLPRSVRLETNSVVYLGSSVDCGLSGPGSSVLGFCVEAWVYIHPFAKKGSDPAISLLSCNGEKDMNQGSCPSFNIMQDGKVVMDFYKCPCVSKKVLVEPGAWTHVAFAYGQQMMKVYINGKRVAERQQTRPWGEVALHIKAYVPVDVCEYRLWNIDRSDVEIQEGQMLSIVPSGTISYPGLRLCWFPVMQGFENYPPGALVLDCWRKIFVGCRVDQSKIVDSRWPCALPPLIVSTQLGPSDKFVCRYEEEFIYFRETRQVSLIVAKSLNPSIKRTAVQSRADTIALSLMLDGGPWIPRVVTLPPGYYGVLGTSAEFGLSLFPGPREASEKNMNQHHKGDTKCYFGSSVSGFTIEVWFRTRALVEGQDNCILGYGVGAPHTVGESLHLVIRDGRPLLGFMGLAFEMEANVIIPTMQWTHLAFTCDLSGNQRIYANGLEIGTHSCPSALFGNCALTVGACGDGNGISGDLCELRIWNRELSAADVENYMRIAIPPLAGYSHKGLRACWLPLRNGGPYSQEVFLTHKRLHDIQKEMRSDGGLTGAAVAQAMIASAEADLVASVELAVPCPTLLWDLERKIDCGSLNTASVLLTTRTRVPPVPAFIPTKEFLPSHWSKSALALLDDWSDSYDRLFLPSWPIPPVLDQYGSQVDIPLNAGSAIARTGPWIPRVLRYRIEQPLSCRVGTTAELGIGSIGAMGRQFTLELWIRSRRLNVNPKKILCQDIFGHEDELSNRGTLLFGLGRPEALRIGLANGYPFMSFGGALRSLKPNDYKEFAIVAPQPIPPEKWTHLTFASDGAGLLRITVDGVNAVDKNRMPPLKAKGDHLVYAFGYPGREVLGDICEMRMWTVYRTEPEIVSFMHLGLTPLDTGGPRIPGLRLCWFPLRSMRSMFWDTKTLRHRAKYHDLSQPVGPYLTRRPHFIPPHILNSITSLPCAPVLDDRGDAFERVYLPDLIPPVVRHTTASDGEATGVDYTALDWSFVPFESADAGGISLALGVPLKKKDKSGSGGMGLGLTVTKTRKEKETIDIGWRDDDDGTWVPNDGFDNDDGGYIFGWSGAALLDKELAASEILDAKSVSFSSSAEEGSPSRQGLDLNRSVNEDASEVYPPRIDPVPEDGTLSGRKQVDTEPSTPTATVAAPAAVEKVTVSVSVIDVSPKPEEQYPTPSFPIREEASGGSKEESLKASPVSVAVQDISHSVPVVAAAAEPTPAVMTTESSSHAAEEPVSTEEVHGSAAGMEDAKTAAPAPATASEEAVPEEDKSSSDPPASTEGDKAADASAPTEEAQKAAEVSNAANSQPSDDAPIKWSL